MIVTRLFSISSPLRSTQRSIILLTCNVVNRRKFFSSIDKPDDEVRGSWQCSYHFREMFSTIRLFSEYYPNVSIAWLFATPEELIVSKCLCKLIDTVWLFFVADSPLCVYFNKYNYSIALYCCENLEYPFHHFLLPRTRFISSRNFLKATYHSFLRIS